MATKDRKRPMSGDEVMRLLQGLTSGVEVAQRSQGSFLPIAGGTLTGPLVVGDSTQIDGKVGVGTEPPTEHQSQVSKNQDIAEPTWEPEDVFLIAGAAAYNVVLTILSAASKRGGIAFSDPDQRVAGAISYDHGDETLRLFTQNVRRLALSATLAKFETLIDFPEQGSSPAAPASGYLRLFPKSADNSLYLKTSAGAERKIYHDGNLVAFVASGSSHAAGLVPDPGASAGTTKFLCEDGTFKTVTSASGVVQTPLGHDISVLPNVISHWPILDTVLGGTSVPDVNGAHSATTTNAIGSVGRPWYNTQGQVWLSAASVQSLASVGSLITEARDASCYWMGWIYLAGEVNATWRLFAIPQSGTGSGANTPYSLYLDSPNSRLTLAWQHGTNTTVTTVAEIAAGLHHVCAMREHSTTSTATIVIDGEIAATASGLTNPSGGGSLTVARLAHSASPTGAANHAVLGDCVWGSGGLPSAAQIRTQYRRGMGSY